MLVHQAHAVPWKFHGLGGDAWIVEDRDLLSFDAARADAWVRRCWADETNREALRAAFGGEGVDDEVVQQRAARAFASGDYVLMRTRTTAQPIDWPTIGPIDDPNEPEEPKEDKPTWIAFTVRDEAGHTFPGHRLSIVLPDGDVRSVVLDDRSSWRADDITQRGTCHLRTDQPFPTDDTPRRTDRDAERWRDAELWMPPDGSVVVSMVTEREHEILVVRGLTEIVLLDDNDAPVVGEPCEVVVAGRRVSGRTDDAGRLLVPHPAHLDALDVRFSELDRRAWELVTD